MDVFGGMILRSVAKGHHTLYVEVNMFTERSKVYHWRPRFLAHLPTAEIRRLLNRGNGDKVAPRSSPHRIITPSRLEHSQILWFYRSSLACEIVQFHYYRSIFIFKILQNSPCTTL
jgi:hypothetical protein